jgi:hypothetical protein
MSTIGLNEGPFLIMTITYENGRFTIADTVENKVPTITLTPADSIYLADSFPNLHPISSTVLNSEQLVPIPESWGGGGGGDGRLATQFSENTLGLSEIILKTKVWGCEYTVTIKPFIDDDEWSTIRTYMEIHNGNFAVKGLFTKDAEEFFQWALDDITHPNDHEHLD